MKKAMTPSSLRKRRELHRAAEDLAAPICEHADEVFLVLRQGDNLSWYVTNQVWAEGAMRRIGRCWDADVNWNREPRRDA